MGAREHLLECADVDRAAAIAAAVTDAVNRMINDQDVSKATSLVARALVARGVVNVAAYWWADSSRMTAEQTRAVIIDIETNLPAGLKDVCFIDQTLMGAPN